MSGSYQTRRWRDLDSNHRSRATHPRFQDQLARDSGQWRYGGANETRGHVDVGHASAGPMVRTSVLNVSLGRLQKATGAPNNRRKSVNLMEGKEEPHRAQAEPIRCSNSSKTFSGVKFKLSVIRAQFG